MATALTVAVNDTASTTLTTANTLATTIATSTQAHPTVLVSTATGYGEVYAQGNAAAWAAAGSATAPSGHGWLLDSTLLEGQEILLGNWTPTLKLRVSSGTLVADIYARAYVYHSGGTYTLIGTVAYLGQTISTTTGTLTGTATSFAATTFATGDKLYIDVVMNITTPAATGVTISPYESNVANQGDATTISWTTPGYVASSVSIAVPDAGTGTDTLATTISAPITDSGTGSETLSVPVSISIPDTATGIDSESSANVTPSITDSATGADSLGVAITGLGVGQPLTALTAYFTNVPATTLTQSGVISQTSGTPTPINASTPIGTATGYGEITALGTASAWAGAGSMSLPTGKGWLLDSTLLEGLGIADGNWTPSIRLGSTSGSIVADIWIRASIYHGSTSGYSTIGIMSLTGQTIGATANYALGSFAFSAEWFNTGDKLYIDVWLNITSNSTGLSTAAMRVFEAQTSTTGMTQSAVITPGYGIQVIAVGTVDTATGTDVQTLGTVIAPQTDSAIGTDSALIHLNIGNDAATGTDSATVSTTPATSFNMNDAGVGTDTIPDQIAIALTMYGQSIADGTLLTANTITPTLAGSPSTTTRTTLLGIETGWSEIVAQGSTSTWQGLTSPGPQSGHGWIYDTSAFVGQSLAIGLWNTAVTLTVNKGYVTSDIQANVSIYHSGTQTYTLLGSMLLQGQTINNVSTAFQLPNTLITDWAFQAGDYIYIDIWANVTVNATGAANAVFSILEYNAGGSSGFRIMTPGIVATLPQVPITDTGSGSESFSFAQVGISLTDSATGADTQGFGTPIFVFDYATGTDGVTLPTITPTLMDATLPDRLAREMLENIMANGYDGHSEINNGYGGLYVNWRYGTNPLMVNFNGTGVPDAYPLPPYALGNSLDIRHDRLTDVRYLQNLYRYKARWPNDHMFDSEITRYTTIIQQDFSTGYSEQRGWVYDVFWEIWIASGNTWFQSACSSLATYYSSLVQSNGMIYTINTTYPYGYYNTGYVLEEACALIHAGSAFTNSTWTTQGYGVLNFMWTHALMSQGVFTAKMINVLETDGITTNPDEAFGDSGSGGNQIKTDYTAQMIISLLHAYAQTSDSTLLAKAQTLLAPLDPITNPLGWWDATNQGYVYYLYTSGSYLSPGPLAISNSKKEAGRQIQMLDAYVLANQYTNNQYLQQQQSLLYVTCSLAYYPAGHGVMYEMATNWSLWPNIGSSSGYEDWITTESMGIALNGLLSSASQPVEISLGTVTLPVTVSMTDTATGTDVQTLGTVIAPQTDTATGTDSSLIAIPYYDNTALGTDTPSIAATVPISDTGTGSDSASLQASIPVPDSATGTDSATVGSVTAPLADNASGSDTISDFSTLATTDAATGTDVQTLGTVIAPQSDTATGTDVQSLGTVLSPESDSATGTDVQSLNTIAINQTDTATGAEALSFATIALNPFDAGAGTDTPTLGTITPQTTDTATGTDQTGMLIMTPIPDSGSGSEQFVAGIQLPVSDTGTGSESIPISAYLAMIAAGLGVDTTALTISFPVPDSGTGTDLSVLPTNYEGAAISGAAQSDSSITATLRG